MNTAANQLRKEVILKAQEYHRIQSIHQNFRPGIDYVPVSGKVCDEEDLSYLIDASLDLWLTTGRFAKEFEETLPKTTGHKFALKKNLGSCANF